MSRIAVAVVSMLSAIAVVPACADEDGIVVDFVLAENVAPELVDALDIWIGMPDPVIPGTFVRDPDSNDMRSPVTFPYTVLIRPTDRPTPILIGGVGYSRDGNVDTRTVEGALYTPVELVPGELHYGGVITLRRGDDVPECFGGDTVTLGDSDGDTIKDCEDCAPMDPMSGPGFEEQCDGIDNNCDGKKDLDEDNDLITTAHTELDPGKGFWSDICTEAAADCDDGNDETHPNALEMCDGMDNSCGRKSIGARPCFFVDGTTAECMIGERSCDDSSGMWESCHAGGPTQAVVPIEMCNLWPAVADTPWPELAVLTAPQIQQARRCDVDVIRPGNTVCGMPDLVYDPQIVIASNLVCRTTLVGGVQHDGYSILLRERGMPGGMQGIQLPTCNVELVVEAIGGADDLLVRLPRVAVIVLFEYDLEADPTIRALPVPVVFQPRFADSCAVGPRVCVAP
jgi:hypothetical protein